MWWFLAPVAIAVGKVIYDAVTDEDDQSSVDYHKTILEHNLERLKVELKGVRNPKIAILGQPGAGKSSLLKKITNGEVRPLPIIGVKTDATNWANDAECCLLSVHDDFVFVDVPGYDTATHPSESFEKFFPFEVFDAFIFVFNGKIHEADELIFELASCASRPTCIVRSYSDGLEVGEFERVKKELASRLKFHKSNLCIEYSSRTGVGLQRIRNFSLRIRNKK